MVAGVALAASFVLSVKIGVFGILPSNKALTDVKNPQGSTVYDRHQEEIGRLFLVNRRNVAFEQMPQCLLDLLVATEDARFHQHKGVDYRSLVRVLFKTVLLQNRAGGGGSTITQQLAKNLFPRQQHGLLTIPVNKTKEILLARRLEKLYSKDEILALYLNTVPFGENVFGVDAAAHHYFNKKASKLQCHEAATLVGMLKANTYYNPRLHPKRAMDRRNTVLALGKKQGYITEQAYSGFVAKPLSLNYSKTSNRAKFAGYFRDQVIKQAKELLEGVNVGQEDAPNIYTSGLKIYTSLDKGMQQYAENAMKAWMPQLQKEFDKQWSGSTILAAEGGLLQTVIKRSTPYNTLAAEGLAHEEIMKELSTPVQMEVFSWNGKKSFTIAPIEAIKRQAMMLSAGFVALSPKTGEVLAWVGGIDHEFFKYDHVGSSPGRQPGSVFKPIIYATALERGIYPCKYFKAEQETYEIDGDEWSPGNSNSQYEGKYSMKGALTESVNTVAVKVLEETGIANVLMVAEGMGISGNLPEVPSLALGTASVPLIEMANAYSAFANQGKVPATTIITKIEDNSGKLLWEKQTELPTEAISPQTAQLMTEMLKNVVNEGTGRSLRGTYGLSMDLAGKTGTTQNNADGWFVGYNPNIVVGVWGGNDLPALHFKTTALGQGAHTALPMFGKFMASLNKDRKYYTYTKAGFDPLPKDLEKHLKCDPFKEEMRFFKLLFGRKSKNKKKKKSKKGGLRKLFKKREQQ